MKQLVLTEFFQLCQTSSPKEVSIFLSNNLDKFPSNDSSYITIGAKNALTYGNLPVLMYLCNSTEFKVDLFNLYSVFSDNIKYGSTRDNFACIDYVLNYTNQHHTKKLTDNLYYCLKVACQTKNIKAIDYLLNKQAVIKLKISHNNYNNILPIFSYSADEFLAYFCENTNTQHQLKPNILNDKGLYIAAQTGSTSAVEYLLTSPKLKQHIDNVDHINIALIKAIIYNQQKVINYLIYEYQITPNSRTKQFFDKNLNENHNSLHDIDFIAHVKKLFDNQNLYNKLHAHTYETSITTLNKNKI